MSIIGIMILSLLLSCTANIQDDKEKEIQITSFSELAEACEQNRCTVEQCQNWYATSKQIDSKDFAALAKICLLLDERGNSTDQQCGIPACFLLAQHQSSNAIDILTSSIPQKSSQKMARQSLWRGFLENPKLFSTLLKDPSMLQHIDRWIGVLIAEMECDEGSISQQMKLQCRERYPIVSEIFWNLFVDVDQQKDESKIQSILHVMLLLDRESGMQKLQNILKGNHNPKIQRIALQVMYMQYMKNHQNINEDVLNGIWTLCKSTQDVDILRGCMLWNQK